MGKRKEESVSKLPSHKRQRQEHTDEHSDESSDEENSQFSADNSFSLTSVSYPKKSSPKIDIYIKKKKVHLCLWLILKQILNIGFNGTNSKK